MTVVTASGGGWYDPDCALAVWSRLYHTNPMVAMNAATTRSMKSIRFAIRTSLRQERDGRAAYPACSLRRLLYSLSGEAGRANRGRTEATSRLGGAGGIAFYASRLPGAGRMTSATLRLSTSGVNGF